MWSTHCHPVQHHLYEESYFSGHSQVRPRRPAKLQPHARLMPPNVLPGTHFLSPYIDTFHNRHVSPKSQNHRMFRVGRDLWGSPSPTPCPTPCPEAGSPRAGCTGPHPGRSWISPEKETPQPPWAAWARALSPSEGRSSSSCSDRTSHAPVCACCPLSCHWAPLKVPTEGAGKLQVLSTPEK